MPGVFWQEAGEWSRRWIVSGRFFEVENKLQELRADEFHGSGGEWRSCNQAGKIKSLRGGGEGGYESAGFWRDGKGAQIQARDNGESTERTDEEFVEVVAGYIFDHAPATFAERAGAIDIVSSEKKIAHRAIGMSKRGIDAGSDDAADSRFKIKRDGKREKLLLLIERRGKIVEICAGINADNEVAGIVVGDFVESGHVDGDVVAAGGHADIDFGAIAAGDERELFQGGEAHDFGDFHGVRWPDDDGGNNFVDGIFAAHGRVSGDMGRAEESNKFANERVDHESAVMQMPL